VPCPFVALPTDPAAIAKRKRIAIWLMVGDLVVGTIVAQGSVQEAGRAGGEAFGVAGVGVGVGEGGGAADEGVGELVEHVEGIRQRCLGGGSVSLCFDRAISRIINPIETKRAARRPTNSGTIACLVAPSRTATSDNPKAMIRTATTISHRRILRRASGSSTRIVAPFPK